MGSKTKILRIAHGILVPGTPLSTLNQKVNVSLCSAFTLVELLMVLGIIALLLGLVLAGLKEAEAETMQVVCSSNLKQFCLAFHLYAQEFNDSVPPNLDGQGVPLGETWVEGWLGMPGPDCTNTTYLQRSLLGRYVPDVRLWHCPAVDKVKIGKITEPRVRTVSLNCFVGFPGDSVLARTYRKSSDILQPGPDEMLTFLEERVETINDASFAMQWGFQRNAPGTWILRDKPEVLHRKRGNIGFADAHVEVHRWTDPRTLTPPRDDSGSPTNSDVFWLQEHSTFRN